MIKMALLFATIAQGTDHLPIWPNRVFNVISCAVVWMLSLFANYWRTHPTSFTFSDWWRDDRTRFVAGCVTTLALVILKATSTTMDQILELLGFKVANTTGASYGFAIAAFLLSLKPPPKKSNGEAKV